MTLLPRTAGGPAFLAELNRFLAEHGHHAPREAEISTPRWREDPTFVLSVLRSHVSSFSLPDPDDLARAAALARERATAEVSSAMGRVRGAVFRRALRAAHDATRLREQLRSCVVETLGMYRSVALEAGSRMAADGLMDRPERVFHLTLDEVRAYLRGEPPEDLALRLAARRAETEAFARADDPPATFTLRTGEPIPARQVQSAGEPLLRGLPGSPGRVQGRARVVRSPSEGESLEPGDILVATCTDVGWTPLFLLVSGVVTEMGGPLSHSCVVAREYGIPAVVNVRGAASVLRDGDTITVDGDAGTVHLEKRD
jgi:pyruvate,water dikinase